MTFRIPFERSTVFNLVFLVVASGLFIAGCGKDDTPPVTPPVDPTVDEKVRPVVFIHDKLEAADAWVPMTQLFTLNGYTEAQLYPMDLLNVPEQTDADVSNMAGQLSSQIDAVIAQTQSSRVDVIAHGAGARAVQYYLTKMNGTARVAHVAFLGGIFDPTLTATSGGATTLIPGPVKYLTIRSDGKDATQATADDGQLTGADNRQIAGLDHQQFLASNEAFVMMHAFFTGAAPSVQKIPKVQNLRAYQIKGRVISMYDNKPIAGASVSFWWIGSTVKGRQSNGSWRTVTADANGYFAFVDTVRPISKIEVMIKSPTDYYESHYYKTDWRYDMVCDRYRMLPRSGGSANVQAIRGALTYDKLSTIALIHTPYQAFNVSRDVLTLLADTAEPTQRLINLLNARTAPPSGSAGNTRNPFWMFVYDYGANQSDGNSPVPVPALDTYGITSFDAYIDASRSGIFSTVNANQKLVYFQNFRGETSGNYNGLMFIRYDYFDDSK